MIEDEIIKQEELQDKIEAFIDTEIKPYIQQDGGDISCLGFNIGTGIVRVKLSGACENCEHSSATLQFGVKLRLMEAFPEIKDIEVAKSFFNLGD